MQALSYQQLIHYQILFRLLITQILVFYSTLLPVLHGLLCFQIFLEVYLETSYPVKQSYQVITKWIIIVFSSNVNVMTRLDF